MDSVLRIVVFQIGTAYLGMDIKYIEDIRKADTAEISYMHSSNAAGMLKLQEDVVPILSLHEKFQIEQSVPQDKTYLLTICNKTKQLAFLADQVEQYYDVPYSYLKMLPTLLLSAKDRYFEYVVKLEDRLVLILNPDSL